MRGAICELSLLKALASVEFWIIALCAVQAASVGLVGDPAGGADFDAAQLYVRRDVGARFEAVGKSGLYARLWFEQLAVNHGFAIAAFATGMGTAWLWGIRDATI